jgi:hypothetical protein
VFYTEEGTAVNSTSGKDPSPYTQAGKENDLVSTPSGIDYSCDGIENFHEYDKGYYDGWNTYNQNTQYVDVSFLTI